MSPAEPIEHADKRNWFESILLNIPGFQGYLEKEYRREADQMARNYLADRLQKSKSGIDAYMQALVAAGQLDGLDQGDRARARLDKLIAGIRGAMQGYSGVFDYVRVDEKLLERVYEVDMMLMTEVDALAEHIEGLSTEARPPMQVFPDVIGRIDEVQRNFDERAQLLKGMGD